MPRIPCKSAGPVSYTHLDVYKRQDEGGEDIQKLLFFQIVVVTETPGGKALVINLRKAHHTIAEAGHGMLFVEGIIPFSLDTVEQDIVDTPLRTLAVMV